MKVARWVREGTVGKGPQGTSLAVYFISNDRSNVRYTGKGNREYRRERREVREMRDNPSGPDWKLESRVR